MPHACRFICSIWTRGLRMRPTCSSTSRGSLHPHGPYFSFPGHRSHRHSLLSHRYLLRTFATLSLCKWLGQDTVLGAPQTRDIPPPLPYSLPCSSHEITHCGVWSDSRSRLRPLRRVLPTGTHACGRCSSRRSVLPLPTAPLCWGGDGPSNLVPLNPCCHRPPSL